MANADDRPESEDYVPVAALSELPLGRVRTAIVDDKEIALIRDGEAVYAIVNHCTHAGSSFARGRAVGPLLTCPMHGARFDLRTGACVNAPYPPLCRHPVRIVGEQVEVALSATGD